MSFSVFLGHLHDLLDPVHVHGHSDKDVGLSRVSAAPHGDDDPLQNPAVPVLTRQRATVVSLTGAHSSLKRSGAHLILPDTPSEVFVAFLVAENWNVGHI